MKDTYVNKLNVYVPPKFSAEQQDLLLKYFTNLDKPVYAFTKEMPTQVAGALISRFSRSNKSPRELFLEEFLQNPDLGFDIGKNDGTKISTVEAQHVENQDGEQSANERASKFFKNVLAKYGDESVAEMTGVYVVVEKASNITIKTIEFMRRMAFIEQSTRYIDLTEKVERQYLYYRDESLIDEVGEKYEKFADNLYDKYREWFEIVKKHVTDKNPMLETDTEAGYKQAIHSRTCDILRELLPIGIRSTVGIFAYGRDWSDLVNIMLASELDEIQEVGKMILEETRKIIPDIMDRCSDKHGQSTQEYFRQRNEILKQNHKSNGLLTTLVGTRSSVLPNNNSNTITAKILSISDNPIPTLAAGSMYNKTNLPFENIQEYYKLNPNKALDLLHEINDIRKSRFDKIPEGFETVRVCVEFTAPWSCWKDIQRHRRLTEIRNSYFVNQGFYIAPELVDLGLDKEYSKVIQDTLNFIEEIKKKYPKHNSASEYLLPHASNFRWIMNMDFAEVIYMIELRSTPGGHMTYRKLMHEFYHEVEKINPELSKLIKFVDLDEYYIGRRQSYNKVVEKGASLE
jgi:thymidylate synthase ThyX